MLSMFSVQLFTALKLIASLLMEGRAIPYRTETLMTSTERFQQYYLKKPHRNGSST